MAVINQCDRVGKTTIATSLGHALAMSGQRVTLVDLDPRGRLTAGYGIFRAPSKGIDRVMLNGTDLRSVRIGARDLLTLIPAGITLAELEQVKGEGAKRVNRLSDALAGQLDDQAFVIFDCPSNNGLLTVNAMFAADELLIPVTSDAESLNGALKTLVTLKRLQPYLPRPVVARVLLNRFVPRNKASREMLQRIEAHLPEALLKTRLHEGPALIQSAEMGRTIFEYKPGSHSAAEFRALARELLDRSHSS
ncbi:MAG: ParA family protein [Candidatus Thiodiazotropha sp.]